MKNNTLKFIWVWVMLCSTLLLAETRSHDEMENVALNFVNLINPEVTYNIDSDWIDDDFSNHKTYSIIALEPRGYVIISNDDRMHPIIGFNLENKWDINESFPPFLKIGLNALGVQLERKKLRNINQKEEAKTEKQYKEIWDKLSTSSITTHLQSTRSTRIKPNTTLVVETKGPLLRSKWHQEGHYQIKIPKITYKNGSLQHPPVGCVATALGQIMNYYQYPTSITGQNVTFKITDYSTGNLLPHLGHDYLPPTTYKYTSSDIKERIKTEALLSYHAGAVMGMRYQPTVSIVAIDNMQNFNTVFGYKSSSPISNYIGNKNKKWHQKLRKDIDNDSPILYQGFKKDKITQAESSHIFICDGYFYIDALKNLKLYHFNWGWGGNHNGWYNLDALNPTSDWHYNIRHKAIFNLTPKSKPILPHAATKVKLSNLDGLGVTITWDDNADNEKGYIIEIQGEEVGRVNANETEFRLKGKKFKALTVSKTKLLQQKDISKFNANTTYKVIVKAYNDAGNYALKDSSALFMTGNVAVLTHSSFKKQNNGTTLVTFTWAKNDASSVILKGITQTLEPYDNNVSGSSISVVIEGGWWGSNIQINSFRNNVYIGSKYYSIWGLHGDKPKAPNVTKIITNHSITLRIDNDNSEKYYKIYQDDIFINSIKSISNITIEDLKENTNYTFKVIACNAKGESLPTVFSVKTKKLATIISSTINSNLTREVIFNIEKNGADRVKLILYDIDLGKKMNEYSTEGKTITVKIPKNHGEHLLAILHSVRTLEYSGIPYLMGNNIYKLTYSNNLLETITTPLISNSIDSDKDGISDKKELALGLNPNNNDSDNDGILDLVEVGDVENPTDTDKDGIIDALDEDSDNDGFTDKDEVAAGTNPKDPHDVPQNITMAWLIPVLYLLH